MNLINNIFIKLLPLFLIMSSFLLADINGTVFRDLPVNGEVLNTYGLRDTNELGIEGVTVTAYPDNLTTTTDSNGTWILATTVNSRIEFSHSFSYLKESPDGKYNNSSIQFIANGDSVEFGLHDPEDFSDTVAPLLVIPSWTNGETSGNTNPALYVFDSNSSGQNAGDVGLPVNDDSLLSGPTPDIDATGEDIGTVWGIAYQKEKERYFASTVLRRHAQLADGLGYIYLIDRSTSPGSLVHKFDLNGTNTTNGGIIDLGTLCRGGGCENNVGNTGIESDYSVDINSTETSIDLDAAFKVAKVAFGAIDMQPETDFLWAVNLNQKALIKMDVSDDIVTNLPNSVDQFLIESIPGIPTCINGELRPWALKFTEGKGYIGVVCDASSGTEIDMRGYILSFNPNSVTSGFTIAIDFPLDYERTNVDYKFKPWTEDFSQYSNYLATLRRYVGAQAVVSDMVLDAEGDMIIALLDRVGLTLGVDNLKFESGTSELIDGQVLGDIFHACKSGSGYIMEGSDGCAINFAVVDQGFNSTGEFFNDIAGDDSVDSSLGGLAILKGSNEVINTQLDPHPSGLVNSSFWNTQGVNFYNHTSGAIEDYYTVNLSSSLSEFGKAAGIGDVEILTVPAPIEIGNRVWIDTNLDGIQDASESGLEGIRVELICGGTVVSSVTTDINGSYIFSNDSAGVSTTSHQYDVSALEVGASDCVVRVPNIDGTSKQVALGEKRLTVSKTGEGINLNNNDSDGTVSGDNADIIILASEIAFSGANNHSFDFGFIPKQSVSIGSLVWEDLNNDGLQDDGESGIADVNVTLLDENGTVMTNPVMQITLDDGQYYFSELEAGSYSISVSPPTGMGYVPCLQQTISDNDDAENDSNIKISNGNSYTSGRFTLEVNTEPTESNGKSGTDSADDSDDDNGNMSVDFCFYRPASIGDYVWLDSDKDGIQDSNESGISGIRVELLTDCDTGTVAGTSVTDSNGKYLFTGLDSGDYCVEFSGLTGYAVTRQGLGSTIDSDVSQTAPYRTASTFLDLGENDLTWDMGVYSDRVSVGDLVWYDLNANGQQDSNETGVSGVTVKLLDATCSLELNSTTTNVNGLYSFSNLAPATYCIEFGNLPSGYAVTSKDNASDTLDSDVDSVTYQTIAIVLDAGENDVTWDLGIYELSSLGDYIWFDDNQNGIQDSNEEAVSNVKVILYESDCETQISETSSDSTGHYSFVNLEPKDYCIGFDELPIGYQHTPIYDSSGGGSALDCNVHSLTGKTPVITLPHATNDITWDMGISPKCNDEEGRALQVFDDSVFASPTSSVTVINILENDFGNLDISTIRFVRESEGSILHENGTAVGGTSIVTYDELTIVGEGVWKILSNGTITFTAEEGFLEVPTPVYYIVGCKEGTLSNVAQATITTCVCEPYEVSLIDSMNKYGMLLTLMLISSLTILFFRKELEEI